LKHINELINQIPSKIAHCIVTDLHGLTYFPLSMTSLDNVDTRSTLEALRELVSTCNSYTSEARTAAQLPNRQLLADAAQFITKMLKVFGATPAAGPTIGFPVEGDTTTDVESLVMPYLTALGRFRERVRQQAREHKVPSVLEECDRVRDEDLTELGVRLEDRSEGEVVFKLVGREALLREREERQRQEEARRQEKERRRLEQLRLEAEREEQRRRPPQEMFRAETDKYSRFDEKGIPTHDKEGKEVSKGQLKKLQKLYQAQEKKHNEYLSAQNAKES